MGPYSISDPHSEFRSGYKSRREKLKKKKPGKKCNLLTFKKTKTIKNGSLSPIVGAEVVFFKLV